CEDCASATNVPTVAGWNGACATANSASKAYEFGLFTTGAIGTAVGCIWQWNNFSGSDGGQLDVWFITTAGLYTACTTGNVNLEVGKYYVRFIGPGAPNPVVVEEAPDIFCAGNQIVGSHASS